MAGRVVFDIETNAIKNFKTLEGLEKIHCLVGENIDTGEKRSFGPREIADGVSWLSDADCLIGHNILRFDNPAIQKFFPHFKPEKVLDTLLLSRMAFLDIKRPDIKRKGFPPKLIGSHSLKSWGYRLGVLKGEFGSEESEWEKFTPQMLTYCEQDVEVNVKLWFDLPTLPEDAVDLEHRFAEIIRQQELNGFCFDVERAQRLYNKLAELRTALRKDLQDTFPAKRTQMKTPQYWVGADSERYRTKAEAGKGAVRGPNKVKIEPFNPDSRQQVAKRLTDLGWKPKVFTSSGLPEVSETTLASIKHHSAVKISRYLMLTKRIGMLAEGNSAWLKLENKGRVHGSVNTLGAVSSRCSHSGPNVTQVPKVGKPVGSLCRSLWTASDGFVMLGGDLSGAQLRGLAHYMGRFDGGAYIKHLLEGDIHTVNQDAAGLSSRENAKTFIYAFLFGAADGLLGDIEGGGADRGKKLRSKFFRGLPALKLLKDAVESSRKRTGGAMRLDGLFIPLASSHIGLCYLLQSFEAVCMKRATVIAVDEYKKRGWWWDKIRPVVHAHDEAQFETVPEISEEAGAILVTSMKKAGEHYNLRCPLDGEYKIGKTWKDTH